MSQGNVSDNGVAPGRRIGLEGFLLLNRHLEALARSQAPLAGGLRIMAQEMQQYGLKQCVGDIAQRLEAGEGLGEALENRVAELPGLYVHLVRAGIAAGDLPGVLSSLTSHFEDLLALRRRVLGSGVQAVIVAAFGLLLTGWVVFTTVPRYLCLYGELGVERPAFTALYGYIGPAGCMAASIAALGIALSTVGLVCFRWTQWRRLQLERLCLRVPGVGGLLRSFWSARLCSTLALLLRNGVPLPRAFSLVAGAVGSALAEQMVMEVSARTDQGEALGAALRASPLSSVFFSNTALLILTASEQSGDLPAAIEQLGASADIQTHGYSQTLQAMVPVAYAVASSVLVAGFVLAMIGPLYNLLGYSMN